MVIRQAPLRFGLLQSRWRLCDLMTVVPELTGYSPSGVCRLVQRAHLTYQRGRTYLHSPDPAYVAKLAAISRAQTLAAGYPGRVVLCYGDEMSLYRQPTLAGCWRRRAESPIARLGLKANYRYRIAGALNAQTGQVTHIGAARCTVGTMRRFLRTLRATYPTQIIILVWDNWPVHAHADVRAEAARLHIRLLWLPTYAPWANPIEKLWRRVKQTLVHHHRYGDDWAGCKAAVTTVLDQYAHPDPTLLRYVGLLPD